MAEREPTHQDISRLAQQARGLIEQLFDSLADHPPASNDENVVVGLSLLRSSLESARAITALLQLEAIDLAGPAHSLYRVQLEHYVRGAYFGDIAPAHELQAFVQRQELPQVPNPEKPGRTRNIPFREWHATVHQHLGLPATDGLDAVVENGWGRFNGLVHGGAQILDAYTRDFPQIAFSMPASAQQWLLEAALVAAHHAAAYYLRVARIPTEVAEPLFEQAIERKRAYESARRKLLTM